MKRRVFTLVLSVLMITALLPQAVLGASSSKAKQPALTETIRGFSAYTATADRISLHWNPLDEAEGVLIYRADHAKGPFKQIARVKYDPEKGSGYTDKKVKAGKTYYYKARPYITVKGSLVKGKMTKASRKQAKYYNPKTASVTVTQTGEKEMIFRIVMKPWSFNTEFFCLGAGKKPELGEAKLTQTWINGGAVERRRTRLQIIGLSKDGTLYQESRSMIVPSGKTIYLKAVSGEALELDTEAGLSWSMPCMYNEKYRYVAADIKHNQ